MSDRIESGPVKFGNDWTGVYIRGDNALYFASVIRQAIEAIELMEPRSFLTIMSLKNVEELLYSAMEGNPETLKLEDLNKCKISK